MKFAATLLIRLIVIVVIEVWITVVAPPVGLLVKETPACCLECSKKYCPMRKSEAEPGMLCHSAYQHEKQCQIRPSCNHTMDQELARDKAILITRTFFQGYFSHSFESCPESHPDPISIPPGTPPPRIA